MLHTSYLKVDTKEIHFNYDYLLWVSTRSKATLEAVSIPVLMQFWKFFKEERADSTPLKDIKPVEPEFELERPGILNFFLSFQTQ